MALFVDEEILPRTGWIARTSTPLGLRFGKKVATFEEWEAAFQQLDRTHKAARWWIGDLLVYGWRHFDERASQAYDPQDEDHVSMYPQYRRVSYAYPEKCRGLGLSWSHYRSAVDEELFPTLEHRMAFLMEAQASGWTVREMQHEKVKRMEARQLEIARQNPPLLSSNDVSQDSAEARLQAFMDRTRELERAAGLEGLEGGSIPQQQNERATGENTCTIDVEMTVEQAKAISEQARLLGMPPDRVLVEAASGMLLHLEDRVWKSLEQMVLLEKRAGQTLTPADIVNRLIRDEECRLVAEGCMEPVIGAGNWSR